MSLRIFHSDMLHSESPVGVDKKDPYTQDLLFRNKIIQKLDYLIKTSKDVSVQDAYKWCKSEIDKRNKTIEEIVKEVESRIADTDIMIKTFENNKGDENQYRMAKKAYENFIAYLKENTDDINKL